jgi:hypothetical protein
VREMMAVGKDNKNRMKRRREEPEEDTIAAGVTIIALAT